MNQVELEVIAPILGSFDHCSHCQVFLDTAGVGGRIHQSDLASYPPDLLDEFKRLSDFLFLLGERYGPRLVIRVVDPGSPRGLWHGLRYRVRRYPTFIVDGSERLIGLSERAVEEAIRARLTPSARPAG